jgi:hypothetical protein
MFCQKQAPCIYVTRRSTTSKTAPREYELVNASVADEIEFQQEEDGVWMHTAVAPLKGKAQRRRRRTIFALILWAIGVLIVVFSGGKRKSVDKESSATTAEGDPLQCLTIFS